MIKDVIHLSMALSVEIDTENVPVEKEFILARAVIKKRISKITWCRPIYAIVEMGYYMISYTSD